MHALRDSPNNVFKGCDVLPWPARSQIFANRACLDCAGRDAAAVPRYKRITADAKTMGRDLPGVISDLIGLMPRRISACVAARGGFTTY
ncbi:hypothetical protein TNCV_3345951 [Trichonephila clavipes]|nr:hypothetical protein TNCV_3345951 [Trichonephila clavipes]